MRCGENKLNFIDMSGCSSLKSFDCNCFNGGYGITTTLNLSGCSALEYLNCDSNTYLTSIDLSGCSALKNLSCFDNVDLVYLDVSDCIALETFDCRSNWSLEHLDVSSCPVLKELCCGASHLKTLNVSGCSALEILECGLFYGIPNNLTTLDLSSCSSLKKLDCSGNKLNLIDVSSCTVLERLDCMYNELKTLAVSSCPKIKDLLCSDNQLTSLTVSGCSNLESLYCPNNQLKIIDISDCPNCNVTCDEGVEIIRTKAIKPTITTSSPLKKATYGSSYSVTLTADGSTPLTWTLSSGTIPNGLKLTKSTGKISGKPTKTGTFTFKIKAKNSAGSHSKTFKITVGKKPSISTSSLAKGLTGTSYSQTLTASGNSTITWSLASGTLPTGLKLTSTGEIYGVPTTDGSYTFTVRATNSYGKTDKQFTIKIGTKPSISTSKTLKTGTKGTKYSVTLKAKGTSAITWSKSSGTLPTGIKLNKTTGKLSGTPTKTGTFSFKIKATNSYGSHTKSFTLTIKNASANSNLAEIDAELNEETQSQVDISEGIQDTSTGITQDEAKNVNALHVVKSGAELCVIDNDGEPATDIVKIAGGQDLLFELGAWFNSQEHETEASGVKVYVNDEALDDVEIYEDGTFVLDGYETGDNLKVYVKAFDPSGEELKTNEIYIVIE